MTEDDDGGRCVSTSVGGGLRASRRRYLAATGAAVALAGCGGAGTSESTSNSEESAATQTETTPATPTPTTGATVRSTASEKTTVVEFDGGDSSAFAAALDSLRKTDGGELRLTPGTYRFDASEAPTYEYPRDGDRVHFDGTGLNDVTIAGPPPAAEGSAKVVLTDPTRGFLLFRNRRGATAAGRPQGPTVRDLTIQHDPLPFTQGRIVDLSTDRRTITLAVDDGFPNVDAAPFTAHEPLVVSANVFTADGARVRRVTEDARSNFKRFAEINTIDNQTAELRLADGIEPGGLQVDRRLVLLPRHQNATQFIHADVTQPTYERVRVHSTANFAFEFNACDRPIVRNCVVTPAPNSGALVATNADGIHCNNCPRGPLVEGNTFQRTSDDPIVADTELLAVREFLDDQTVAVAATFGTRVGAGDRLVAAASSLERIGMLPAVDAVDERGGGITDDAVNPESITFTDSVRDTLTVGDALVGPRMRNRETVVRNNTVEATRARYVRFGGVAGGVIEENRFLGTNANGIELDAAGDIRPGFSDLKGWSTDVRIRDNEIRDTGLVGVPSGIPRAIVVGVDGGEGLAPNTSTTGRPHQNISLSNNRIRGVAGHGIELADVEGVTVDSDRIENPNRIPVSAVAAYGIGLRNVSDVNITGVTVQSDTDLAGFGWHVESEEVSTSNNRFQINGTERQATFKELGNR